MPAFEQLEFVWSSYKSIYIPTEEELSLNNLSLSEGKVKSYLLLNICLKLSKRADYVVHLFLHF